MEDKIILKSTELTGVLGKNEINKLSGVVEERIWKNYRDLYEKASNLHLLDFPIQIDFELNASCNLRCPMCPISVESPKGKGKSTWFSFDFFKEIIDYSVKNGTKAIKLNYVNEPLIRKDIISFIKYAKLKGVVDIYLSTNGILLNNKISNELIKSGLTRIQVSIDAFTEKTYQKVRPGGTLDKVISNLYMFLDLRKKLKSITPLVRVNFVKTSLNEFELEKFLKFWEDKVDMIGVQEFIKPTKVKNHITSKKSINKRENNFKCSFPFKQVVITNEKKILPCCTFWGEELVLQELSKPEDIKKAWNSDKMKMLRDIHRQGKYYEVPQCKNCVEGGLE